MRKKEEIGIGDEEKRKIGKYIRITLRFPSNFFANFFR